MTSHQTHWLLCPTGLDDAGTGARLSLVVFPQLSTDGPASDLSTFEAFLDWPATLSTLVLGVDVLLPTGDVAELPAEVLTSPPPDGLWSALFPPTTPVSSFGGARIARRPTMTYLVADVAATIKESYVNMAVDAVDRPAETYDGSTFDLRPLESFDDQLSVMLESARSSARERTRDDGEMVNVTAPDRHGHREVARAFAFHRAARLSPVHSVELPDIDFHQALTLLGDHPILMRSLGLLVDLGVGLAGVPNDAVAVRARVEGAVEGAHHAPWTRLLFQADARLFHASPRDPIDPVGVVRVDTLEYYLEHLDVDSAVMKNVVAVASASSAAVEGSPPALRTDGIALVHNGRAGRMNERVIRADVRRTALQGAGPTIDMLDAEDLVRGYRADIWDDVSGEFHSLHERLIRYVAEGFGPLPTKEEWQLDEGFVQDSVTGDTEIYVHEKMLTWRGWSLSAPTPQDLAGRKAPLAAEGRLRRLRTHLEVRVKPGSLPMLRFGRSYRVRLRSVDLAGGGPSVRAAPDVTTEPLMFTRYEPVPPPVIAPDGDSDRYPLGETLHRLVLRDQGSEMFETPPPPPTVRVLLAPRGSAQLAELHGKYDAAITAADRAGRVSAIPSRGRSNAELTFPVGDVPPYLPDPMAIGISFVGLPGVAEDESVEILYDGDWDQPHVVRLQLAPDPAWLQPTVGPDWPGPAPPSYDAAAHQLTVYLQPGITRKVIVSSMHSDPDCMAILRESRDRRDTETADRGSAAARSGRHPLLTPGVELELVYALPTATRLDFTSDPVLVRGVGATAATVICDLAVRVETTFDVSVDGSWVERRDDPALGPPSEVTRSATLSSMPLSREHRALASVERDSGRQSIHLESDGAGVAPFEFGDTKHRRVQLVPRATGRFGDCYPPGTDTRSGGNGATCELPSTATPPPPQVAEAVPTQLTSAQYTQTADELADNVTESGPDEVPMGPGWSRTVRHRTGGGIRIYLDRPWFTSGDGEMLGVLVAEGDWATPPPGASQWAIDTSNPLLRYASQIGEDPARTGVGVRPLMPWQILNPDLVVTISAIPSLLVEGGKGGWALPATVAAFHPTYEEESGRWFVDVQMHTGQAYMPFVRLVVARYQPNSLSEEVSLSGLVGVDVVQPLPDRVLTLVRDVDRPTVRVVLRGPTYGGDSSVSADVSVQVFSADSPDAGRWQLAPSVDELVLARDPINACWVGELLLPPPEPGRVLRVVVVERDQEHSEINDAGPGAKRIVYVGTLDL